MSSTPNGACNSLLERDSGVGDTLHDFDRAQRISTSQEQLLRTQLQQLGLEAGDDVTAPCKDANVDTPSPIHSWPATTWGHDALDSFGAARVAGQPWPSAAPPLSFPRRNADINTTFRFPSSRPNYVSASDEVEQQRHAIQRQIEQLQRRQEQLQWHQQMLQPHFPISAESSQPHQYRGPLHNAAFHGSSLSGSWIPHLDADSSLRSNFTFPPRPLQESSIHAHQSPPQLAHPIPVPTSKRADAQSAENVQAQLASQQLSSELSPEFLMAGGGLVNLTTLGLGGAWNESDDKGIDTIATPRSAQRHTRSSSASSAMIHRSSMDNLLSGLPQAQAQLAALHRSRQQIGPNSHGRSTSHGRSASMGSNAGVPRRALFGSYLPQTSLPLLLLTGKLVVGILRVNKRNRSDAWVSTEVLEHDIFISGSKDRNRALEGDIVAVELLNPQEVWQTKRDKVDKKKRKEEHNASGNWTVLTARGAGRRADKARDDIEVEGAQLKLIQDEEESENKAPLLAGHVVAIVERMPGQIFPGTLALLRPSSAATKEKQQAERGEDDDVTPGTPGTPRPKIVWFRPSDKRVPLIAIPADQAPDDFWIDGHQEKYSRCLFVACIKRWPITSLHPFGSLVDRLGPIGSLEAESQALVRSHCHSIVAPISEPALRCVPTESPLITDTEAKLRRSFCGFTVVGQGPCEVALSVDPGEQDTVVVGVHVADITHFLSSGSALDRESLRRGASVHLVQHSYEMLPSSLLHIVAFQKGRKSLAKSVVFTLRKNCVVDMWMGRSIIHVSHETNLLELEHALQGGNTPIPITTELLGAALEFARQLRSDRISRGALCLPRSRLEFDLDEQQRPTCVRCECDSNSNASLLLNELCIRTNTAVAHRLAAGFESSALLLRQDAPLERALEELWTNLTALGVPKDQVNTTTLPAALAALPSSFQSVGAALVEKALSPSKFFTPALVDVTKFAHYSLGEPVYTHFTSPLQRYSNICVHRQLDAILDDKVTGTLRGDIFTKLAHQCNVKEQAALAAEMQSTHLYLCQWLKNESKEGIMKRRALVMALSETSVDVLVPSLLVEKRVYLDCLPLDEAKWDPSSQSLMLTWSKGIHSIAWFGHAIDDAQCMKVWETEKERQTKATSTAPVCQQQRIMTLTEVDVFILSDMDKSPPILKVVIANPCA